MHVFDEDTENEEKEDVDWKELIDKKGIGAICLTAIVLVMLFKDYPYSDVVAIITLILQTLGLNGDYIGYKVRNIF